MGEFAELWRAVVLGLVQAATEFLPISSSGHLILAPELIGDDVSSLTFDVALHLGTMVAVIAFFWRDWLRIIGSGLADIVRHGPRVQRWEPYSLLGLWIVLGTIPAVVVGLLFKDAIEENLREPWLVGTMLIGFGVCLVLVLLQAVVQTDRERIIAICRALAVAAEDGDVAAIGKHVADHFETQAIDRAEFLALMTRALTAGDTQSPPSGAEPADKALLCSGVRSSLLNRIAMGKASL